MKKLYIVNQPKQPTKKVIKAKVRNELHFMACLNSNVAYVSKDKSKVIPRKQKYKNFDY